jgi:hypothetical protein
MSYRAKLTSRRMGNIVDKSMKIARNPLFFWEELGRAVNAAFYFE